MLDQVRITFPIMRVHFEGRYETLFVSHTLSLRLTGERVWRMERQAWAVIRAGLPSKPCRLVLSVPFDNPIRQRGHNSHASDLATYCILSTPTNRMKWIRPIQPRSYQYVRRKITNPHTRYVTNFWIRCPTRINRSKLIPDIINQHGTDLPCDITPMLWITMWMRHKSLDRIKVNWQWDQISTEIKDQESRTIQRSNTDRSSNLFVFLPYPWSLHGGGR